MVIDGKLNFVLVEAHSKKSLESDNSRDFSIAGLGFEPRTFGL
jgi:hypothetical protein